MERAICHGRKPCFAPISSIVGGWPLCQQVWCPGCYTSSPKAHFREYKPDLGERYTDDEADRMQNIWRRDKREKNKFNHARRGDHLVTQFECDYCFFHKLKGLHPVMNNPKDIKLLVCICHINLDAFWSRASETVTGNAELIKKGIALSAAVGIVPPYLEQGPVPAHD